MGEHGQKEGLAAILLLLKRVRVVQGAYLKRVDVLENVQLLQGVFQPRVGVIA